MTKPASPVRDVGAQTPAFATFDVHPVRTHRQFDAAQMWAPLDSWNPFLKHHKPYAELVQSFHVYTDTSSGVLDVRHAGGGLAPVADGRSCVRFTPSRKGAIAGATYKHPGIPNTVGKKHGSAPFEEYILDFSTYQDVGKFHLRYFIPEGKRYKVMVKVDTVELRGTGQWRTVVIGPLKKELFTHHNLLWLEALDDEPGEIYVDDAFFFKGEPPADSQVDEWLTPG